MTGSSGDVLAGLRAQVDRALPPLPPSVPPWDLGYSVACSLRQTIGLSVTDAFEVDEYLRKTIVTAPDRSLQALGGEDTVALGRPQIENSERFTLARALWHLLRSPQQQFLITPGHTMRHKAERAFAAEVLAPAAGVAQLIGDKPDDIGVNELEEAGQHFRVSSLIIQHQIDNQLSYA